MAEVEFLHILLGRQLGAGAARHSAAEFKDGAVVRGGQRDGGVLFHHHDGGALLGVDAGDLGLGKGVGRVEQHPGKQKTPTEISHPNYPCVARLIALTSVIMRDTFTERSADAA